jgi:lipopolysaccharide export system protein LptA
MRILIGAILAIALGLPAHAQSLKFQPKNTENPIEVSADNGLELQQDAKRVIARGNAKLVQGDVSVVADELIADYRDDNDIYRVYATGNVTMKSASETATGQAAVYDVDKAVLVLTGDPVTLVSNDGTVTAHQTLQYWANERVAVAEGNASAGDTAQRQIRGDKLIAFFRETGSKDKKPANMSQSRDRGDINYVQAFGNVRMQTANEDIRSERGAYNIDTGVATLEGNVRITRDKNQLNGGFATVNVRGGVSKLFANAGQAGQPGMRENARVRALIAPSTKPAVLAPADVVAPPPQPPSASPKAKQ